MKKLFEFQVSELITTKATVKQIEKLLTDYSRTGKIETLLAAQENIHKVEQTVAAAIKSVRPVAAEGDDAEMDWDKAPKAPVFVLNLAKRYPQNEAKYYKLWYKAVDRSTEGGKAFNYGAGINIFRAYAKREQLQLEGVDFDAEIARYGEVNESVKRSPLSNIKMFEDFDMDDEDMEDDVDTDEDSDGPPYYFFIDGDSQAIVEINRGSRGGSYRETLVRGEEPYGFGSKTYQSYLSADDILSWLRKDYGDVTRIKEEEFDDYLPEE